MNILFTAFKGKNNTSYKLVSSLNCNALYLTNSFIGLKRDIDLISEKCEAFYMFGFDKSLKNSVRMDRRERGTGDSWAVQCYKQNTK